MPSLGRIVIVPADPATNNGSDEAPAIVTRVWSEAMINVKVQLDSPINVEWRTSVTLHDEKPEKPGHDAWWPPRV